MDTEEQKLTKKERRKLKKEQKAKQLQKEEQQAKQKKWLVYGVIGIVVLLVGYFFYQNIVPIPPEEKDKPVDKILANDWARGETAAPIVLLEYSDFQCPACQNQSKVLEEILTEYDGEVVLVYRHFPLSQTHQQANLAAEATEAAGNQGYFWEMHDLLFANQSNWAENRGAKKIFIGYAEEIDGMDVNQFKKDLGSKEVKARVKADYMSALSLNLNSTPSLFMNGERINNFADINDFTKVYEEMFVENEGEEAEVESK